MKNWLILFQISSNQYLFSRASHDSFVLSNSGLSGVMEHLEGGGWLLGDSGYPLNEWLLTPFLSPANEHEVK